MRINRKVITLFDAKDLFSIKHVISISNEEDLNQFWDYLSLSCSRGIFDGFIAQFYNFALSYMLNDDAEFFEVIIEESESHFYFTLWNKKISLLFKEYLKNTSLEQLYDKNRISVMLNKQRCKEEAEKRTSKIKNENEKRENNLINSVNSQKKENPIEAYTFINHDDLDDIVKLSDDMQELISQAKQVGLQKDIFISLRSSCSLFCLTLRYYDEISHIATTITDFSNLINLSMDRFLDLNQSEVSLIEGFINNIDYWIQTLFIRGGADLYFMDNSIKADYEMIQQRIIPDESKLNTTSFDDIFNF